MEINKIREVQEVTIPVITIKLGMDEAKNLLIELRTVKGTQYNEEVAGFIGELERAIMSEPAGKFRI